MKILKKFICLLLALTLSAALVSCKKQDENVLEVSFNADEESVYKNLGENTLWLSAWGFDTFNPIATTSKSVADCAFLVYDSLFYLDNELFANAVLAKDYSVSDDKKTYTIELNTDFKFHDGSAFSSADVVYTVKEIKRMGQNSLFFEYVENIESVSAKGDNEVVIKIVSPEPLFINNLVFPIVKKNTSSMEKVEEPIGTGPYKFVKTNLVRAMYFEENENYAGKRASENKMKNAVVTFVPDKETQTYALEARRSDAACVTSYELANYNPKGAVNTTYYNNKHLVFIGINSNSQPLADKTVRRAVSLAVDRQDIINSVLFGNGEPVLLPFDVKSYIYPEKYKDVSKKSSQAASELKDSGWIAESDAVLTKTGADGKKIRASFSILVNKENESRVQCAQKIAENLKQIGINVNVLKTDFNTYKSKIESGNYEAYIGEVYMDNSYSSDVLFSEGATLSIYSSEKLKNAVSEKKMSVKREQTVAAFEKLSDCIAEEMPIVCLYFGCDAIITNNMLKCPSSFAAGSEFANLRLWTKENQ